MVVKTLHLFAFFCRTQVIASYVWALCLSLWEATPLSRRRLCHPRAPLCSSSLLAAEKHSRFPSTVTEVLFKRSSRHRPMSQQLYHSSKTGTVVGTTGQLDLRRETAAILGCRSRNSQETSALIRPHLDTASCFGTRNTWTT